MVEARKHYHKEMTLAELEASGKIIYSVIGGSHAYGTNTPESDVDHRGYYWVPPEEYVSLYSVHPQVGDDNHDSTYYTLARAFELLKTANPNQIELLWIPQDCVKVHKVPIMCEMLQNRYLFLSKQTYFTHASYAAQQIKKAKGKNKKVHNAGFYEKGLNKLSELLNKGEITDEWIKSRFSETILREVRKRIKVS